MAISNEFENEPSAEAAACAGSEHPARERLFEQARETSHEIQQLGGLATAAAQEQLGQIRNAASAYLGHERERFRGVVGVFEQFVRERPVRSLLIAAGIGLLIGRSWRRR